MNPAVIILALVVIVLLYILYIYYFKSNTLVQLVNLKTQRPTISFEDIENPTTPTYSFGVWMYINSWSNGENKVIFSTDKLKVLLGNNTTSLSAIFGQSTTQNLTILDAIPIQRWVQLIISVNNNYIDFYINGKLVSSNTLLPTIPVTYTSSTVLQIGNPQVPIDMFLAKFKLWSQSMDPQTAWNSYLEGSGVSSTINAQISIVKDNTIQSQYSLFN